MANSKPQSSRHPVETQIVAVTVYTNQALVTRRGKVELTGQETELVLTQLPVTLETESIRISGAGQVKVRLLGVLCDRVFATEPIARGIAELTQQIQELETEKTNLQAQVDAIALQSRFIDGLREKTEEQFAISLARKSASLSDTLDLVNFLGSQFTEYAIATADYKAQQQEIDKQIHALQAQLSVIQTPSPKESYELTIPIQPAGAGKFELEISYLVNSASWTPLYDLRIDNNKNSVGLSYSAQVNQNSGEDWHNVALTLSTAKPGLGTLPPKLDPWYIDVPRIPLLPKRFSANSTDQLSPAPASPPPEEPEENAIAAEIAIASVSKQGSVVTFKLNDNGNIPSDGTPHKTTIFNDDFPCRFEYVAVPRVVSFAYLQANVKNSLEGVTLLPGKANIFREGIFVGSTQLENIAPGQEFTLNLGTDERWQIERDLIERNVDKKLIGHDRKITYTYRLVITNLQPTQANLQLTEQLPVSRNEQIKVRLTKCNPQIQATDMGILSWKLNFSPLEKRDIFYQFVVEHPAQLPVVGLEV